VSEPVVRLSHYIAGEWLVVNGQEWTADINPSDATEELARVPSADATAVNRAAEAAHSGFEGWRAASGPQRADILHRTATLLAQRRQDIATLVALEVGKPIEFFTETKTVQINPASRR
jgi:acyl-CoA reductase-like NAD-dependent aldehyde dehydrogenase